MNITCLLKPLIFLGGILFAEASCNSFVKEEHPEYYGKYSQKFETVFDQDVRASIINAFQADLKRNPAGVMDMVTFYNMQWNYYLTERNSEKVFQYIDSVILVIHNRLEEEKYLKIYIGALLGKSEAYGLFKNYDDAMKYLVEAKLVFNKMKGGNCAFLRFSERIGNLFYKQGRYKHAISYFKKAIEDEKYCDKDTLAQFALIQGYLDNIGSAYRELDMNDSAMFYLNEAFTFIQENEHRFPQKVEYIKLAKAVVYGNMAKVKREERRFAESENFSLLYIKGLQNPYIGEAVDASFELADTYIEWGKFDKALDLLKALDTSGHFYARSDIMHNALHWNKSMKDLYAKKKDTIQAFIYNQRYIALKDSVDMLAKKNVTRDISAELETIEKTLLHEGLEKENRKTSFQLGIVLTLALLVAIIALFMWHNWRHTAQQESVLEKLNQQIKDRNRDIEETIVSLQQIESENIKITRMVAHDLKNPVGGIRNLLHIFIKKQTNNELKSRMEEMNADCKFSIDIINELVKKEYSANDI